MTILRVFDTVLEAKTAAERTYKWITAFGFDLQYHAVYPYVVTYQDQHYVYVVNKAEYVRGMRVDKIEDYTRKGLCDEIKACEYPLREG